MQSSPSGARPKWSRCPLSDRYQVPNPVGAAPSIADQNVHGVSLFDTVVLVGWIDAAGDERDVTRGADVRADGPGTVHVLIVGVGSYDGGVNGDLPGVAGAARRVRDWFRTAEARFIDGRRIGSIETLVSGPGPAGSGSEDGVPTAANVRSAADRWIRLCHEAGDRGMGFLFWVGHGTAIGSTNGSVSQALLCKDWNDEDPEGGFQEGIDWTRTLQAINARRGAARIFCFIDACRSTGLRKACFRAGLTVLWARSRGFDVRAMCPMPRPNARAA